MFSQRPLIFLCFAALVTLSPVTALFAQPPTEAGIELFESRIRPVLIEHCYECHNSVENSEGGFAIDYRDGLMRGGDSGKVVLEGDAEASRLIKILRHEIDGLEMPEGGAKLDEAVIQDFERWIQLGIPDPRKDPPSAEDLAKSTSWEQVLQRRKQWWSFRPIESPDSPDQTGAEGNPIDAFLDDAIQREGLVASPPAETPTLVRRLFFAITGLPPTAEEAARWTTTIDKMEDRRAGIETLVDALLDDPTYGERWARHWMDWIRYAESHGSEGDPRIENAWLYRDYLIRALNQDVPYDQLVMEHLAGDLIQSQRINDVAGINESVIGTAQLRMVFHGFAPTDALDEKVRFIDDQINVISKAFMGLTVSCARCHDHKFDAISQADYYALFGILGSCRPGRNVIDVQEKQTLHQKNLLEIKEEIRQRLAQQWTEKRNEIVEQLLSLQSDRAKDSHLAKTVARLGDRPEADAAFPEAWKTSIADPVHAIGVPAAARVGATVDWNLASPSTRDAWFKHGVGLRGDQPSKRFSVALNGDQILTGVYPAGVYSHLITPKHPGRLTSPDVVVGDDSVLWAQVIGEKDASLRYVVQDYPRNGTVYPVKKLSNRWSWQKLDLAYWSGDSIHVELTTAKDAPLLTSAPERSWFGVRRVIIADRNATPPNQDAEVLVAIARAANGATPKNSAEFKRVLLNAFESTTRAWRDGEMTDSQSLLLDELLRLGVLPNSLAGDAEINQLVVRYRELEREIPVPTRVPGVEESVGSDQPLMVRGNHKKLGEPVPRRFLEAIDDSAYETNSSGRLEFAEDLVRDDNPLVRRVVVNRVWHHLFGRGIVATPDNFGQLGSKPSHPKLLDWMATRFADDGWSFKKLIRLIVTSNAWQRSAAPVGDSLTADPENTYLSRANVRRLEAEAIRDALLAVSGRLDRSHFGPPQAINSTRRTVYVRVIRNSLDPFLRAFDFPEPFSAVGRRDVTNVPAQSLAIMNDAKVAGYANAWMKRSGRTAGDATERVRRMFMDAFGRPPNTEEIARSLRFVDETRSLVTVRARERARIANQLGELQDRVDSLLAVARSKITEEGGKEQPGKSGKSSVAEVPKPIASWEFTKGLEDLIGDADVRLMKGARRDSNGLLVRGGSYGLTGQVGKPLKAKTLEAWVKLDDLKQRGGGVMSVQTRNGILFDAIVFAEQQAGHWLAGSNNFARTERFQGERESEATETLIHIAIAYSSDGQITGYRNGVRYGKSYRSSGPQVFQPDDLVVGFGVRHLPPGGNRMLSGRILKARLYDQELSEAEIAASAGGSALFISQKELLAALSASDRDRLDDWRTDIAQLKAELVELPETSLDADQQAWSELARALFSLQEFIYVR